MSLTQKAIMWTLLVHVVVLSGLLVWPVSEGISPSETFAEVSMLSEDDVQPQEERSFEQTMRDKLAQKVANVRANASAKTSSEARSSADGHMDESELAAEVEAELRAMEAAEFERLAADEKEFETAGEADVQRQQVNQTFEKWDAQYDGLVTVRFSLQGRSGRDLDVPGYTCVGGAQVDVDIVVNRQGKVVDAQLRDTDDESCFGTAALRSAFQARFNAASDAPAKQRGRLTYVFVAQ